MKTLLLPPNPRDLTKNNVHEIKVNAPHAPVHTEAVNDKPAAGNFLKRLFPDDAAENLSTTEAVIRGALVFTMPVLSSVDWNFHTHTMIFIAPIIFYLEVTAFTMYCPIKRLFSNYTHPSKYE